VRNLKTLLILGLLLTVGCAPNRQEMLDRSRAIAMQTALNRGQFEMNCSSATGAIISRHVVQSAKPLLQGPLTTGIPAAQYTIDVKGCSKANTYVVMCPAGGNGCSIPDAISFIGKQPQ
jgi:hypothetical protein